MNEKKQTGMDADEVMKKSFGLDKQLEAVMARMPGVGPKTGTYGYTSETEIREKAAVMAQTVPRKLTDKQLAAVGIDQDPALKLRLAQGPKTFSSQERAELIERWVNGIIAKTRKAARLMTDQQLADWRIGRKLGPGDRVRYIGPSRNETTQSGLVVPREHGQLGIITGVQEGKDARIITFHPMEAVPPIEAPGVDKQFVDLQVREHTAGWLQVERVPMGERSALTGERVST